MGERIGEFQDSDGRQVVVVVSSEFNLVKIENERNTIVMDAYDFRRLIDFIASK